MTNSRSKLPDTSAPSGSRWRAPLVSTVLTILLYPVVRVISGFAAMAFDPCTSTGCPQASAQYSFSESAITAAVVLVVLQWPVVRFVPRGGRGLVSAVAPGVMLVAALGFITMPVGR
ncbi:hypothetical protein [Kitasatospora sp. GP82]|uniref:hypothetical protein n=1 Tax=Kitasatospora sp. GP82 TaxID=3035089 RepID=UPI0024755CF9|nr:hypothetical protein [Kitasatospora sp. GP82]MDH6126507.1 hypothetical protein [Kitasatospora sp. GP82]